MISDTSGAMIECVLVQVPHSRESWWRLLRGSGGMQGVQSVTTRGLCFCAFPPLTDHRK
jgi:hypothetical protein